MARRTNMLKKATGVAGVSRIDTKDYLDRPYLTYQVRWRDETGHWQTKNFLVGYFPLDEELATKQFHAAANFRRTYHHDEFLRRAG